MDVLEREELKGTLQRTGGEAPRIKINDENLRRILTHDEEWAGRIYYDELYREVRLDGEVPGDTAGFEVAAWISREYELDFPATKVDRAIDAVGMQMQIHPVADYLCSLTWDGVPRIETWLTTYAGVEDTPLHRAYGRRWLMQCVMRALVPGCQADSALIFQSEAQGLKKSTLLRLLGREWFSESPINIGDEQSQGMALRGVWIAELAEMASVRKKDQEAVKQFLTIKEDRYRAPYGRRVLKHPRTCVFCGTTNPAQILVDPTGSRRFWVVAVQGVEDGKLAMNAMVRDRDQLWAECMARVQAWVGPGEDPRDLKGLSPESFYMASLNAPDEIRWWLTDEEEALRMESAQEFSRPDAIEDLLLEILDRREWYTNQQLLTHLEIDVTRNPGAWSRLGPLLAQHGWVRWQKAGRKGSRRGWKRSGVDDPTYGDALMDPTDESGL